jgi:hypothetical protein
MQRSQALHLRVQDMVRFGVVVVPWLKSKGCPKGQGAKALSVQLSM